MIEVKGPSIHAVPRGSILWIRSKDPMQLIQTIPYEVRRRWMKDYYVLITDDSVELKDLTAEDLRSIGLRVVPTAMPTPPKDTA